MIVSRFVRLILCIVGCGLILPIAGIGFQDTVQLEIFHGRTLAKWPSGKVFWVNPAQYFAKAQSWVNDRAYPIIQTTYLKNNLLYSLLNTLPQRRVSLGHDGFLFVNGADDTALYGLFNDVCVDAPAMAKDGALQQALSGLAASAKTLDYAVDVVLVPTLPTLYGDRLPRSVPEPYRWDCRRIAESRSPLLDIRSPPNLRFVYPFKEMYAGREDPAFFPKANYHPYGLSLIVIRDAYLAAIGVRETIDETMTPKPHLSEVLSGYGIDRYPLAYEVDNPNVKEREDIEAVLDRTASLSSKRPSTDNHAYRNDAAVDPRTILILSDSYGDASSGIFAGAFRTVLQVHCPDDNIAATVSDLFRLFRFDRLVLLFNEGNSHRIAEVGAALHRSATRPDGP